MRVAVPRAPAAALFWGAAVLAVAWAELALQEAYHRVSSSSVGLVVVLASAVLVTVAAALVRRFASGRRADLLQRLICLLAVLVAGYWILGGTLVGLWDGGAHGAMLVAGAGGLVAAVLLLRADGQLWARIRLALLVAGVLFVGIQPVLGALHAKDLAWPPGFQQQDAAADAGHVATIVLLLDELNARNAGPIAELLRQQGLQVATRAVPSVGDGTARVLPAMFTGQLFPEARPCGLTTICSGNQALDFSRIRATRPDIDVVGFYHPYCAMQGLRSCERPAINLAIFDSRRWHCGLWRRFGWPHGVDAASCQASAVGAWGVMSERVLAGLRRAPTLTQGGLLFAHLPLPHPPGHSDDGALAQHYDANLLRAASAVGQTLRTAASHGLAVRVLIFSDHPLRQPAWCRGYPGFFSGACEPVERLLDDKVPLIVAGATTPDLSAHTSNLNVFALMAGWVVR